MAWVSLAIMMAYVFSDVVGRFLGFRTVGTVETIELLMPWVVYLAAALCQLEKRHMRVDFLFTYISQKARTVIDVVSYVLGIAGFSVFGWYSAESAIMSWRVNEQTWGVLSLPVYPSKLVLVIGCYLFVLQLLVDLVAALRQLSLRPGPG